jgi:hypothetical protein
MKSNIFKLAMVAVVLFSSQLVISQEFRALDKSPLDAATFPSDYRVADKLVKITYSRPQLNGRLISDLAPNGKVWRTGANEACEITFYVDMKLGSNAIKAGTYTFYTIPGEKEWTAIINKDLNVWGSYFYDESKDVARLSVPVSSGDEALEAFSMVFSEADNGVTLHIGWGNMRLAVPFTK